MSVEVEFVDAAGSRRRGQLASCWSERFEACAPVREFPSYRGQRNWPGLWWFSRTGEHVGYESWVERDALMTLDADPGVVAVASQPMWLYWVDETGKARRHAPDFFARLADGTGVLIDVRPRERMTAATTAVFSATAAMAAGVGWDYRTVGALEPVAAANLRWLAGYRHPRCARPPATAVMASLREVFAEPTGLHTGAARVGDPVAVLPVLFAMLWRRELLADLAGTRLGATSTVWTPQTAARTADGAPASLMLGTVQTA